jgi:hypothetical protein
MTDMNERTVPGHEANPSSLWRKAIFAAVPDRVWDRLPPRWLGALCNCFLCRGTVRR